MSRDTKEWILAWFIILIWPVLLGLITMFYGLW